MPIEKYPATAFMDEVIRGFVDSDALALYCYSMVMAKDHLSLSWIGESFGWTDDRLKQARDVLEAKGLLTVKVRFDKKTGRRLGGFDVTVHELVSA